MLRFDPPQIERHSKSPGLVAFFRDAKQRVKEQEGELGPPSDPELRLQWAALNDLLSEQHCEADAYLLFDMLLRHHGLCACVRARARVYACVRARALVCVVCFSARLPRQQREEERVCVCVCPCVCVPSVLVSSPAFP